MSGPDNKLASAFAHELVVTSDTVNQAFNYRYLLFTVAGSLRVTNGAGVTYVIPTLPAGTYFMGEVRRVWATGGSLNATAGANVLGFY